MLLVSAGIIEKDGKILIAKRRKGKCLEPLWEFPGGKLEEGETPQECLRRELMEELNIDTSIGEYFCSTSFYCGDKFIKLLAYKVRYVSGEMQMNDHDDIQWVSLNELKDFEFVRADTTIVKKLLEE